MKYLTDRIETLKSEFGNIIPSDLKYDELVDELICNQGDWISRMPSTWKSLSQTVAYCSSNSSPLSENSRVRNLLSKLICQRDLVDYIVIHRVYKDGDHYRSYHSNSDTIDDNRVIFEDNDGVMWFGTVETFLMSHGRITCALYCHERVQRQNLAPVVPSVDMSSDNILIVPFEQLKGICVYINIQYRHYFIPVDGLFGLEACE